MIIKNLLGEIHCFLDNNSSKSLEIVFGTLEIQTYSKGRLLQTTIKKASRLRVYICEKNDMPQIDVLDHLVFHFSFQFPRPEGINFFESTALLLPRPLAQGFLKIDSKKIQLEFNIDSPDKNLQIHVKHIYLNAIHMKRVKSI